MEKYDFFKKDGVRPSEEQLRLTKLFYQNAPEIYAHFNEWKDIDKFYFIPLHMEMTYSCSGWVAEIPSCAAPWSIRSCSNSDARGVARGSIPIATSVLRSVAAWTWKGAVNAAGAAVKASWAGGSGRPSFGTAWRLTAPATAGSESYTRHRSRHVWRNCWSLSKIAEAKREALE